MSASGQAGLSLLLRSWALDIKNACLVFILGAVEGREVTNRFTLFLMASFLVLLIAGCATSYKQIRQGHINKHPEWTEQEKQDVLAGEPKIGMSKEQAVAAHRFSCMVYRSEVRKTTTARGTREDWFWFNMHGGLILHMSFNENGRLDYWSES